MHITAFLIITTSILIFPLTPETSPTIITSVFLSLQPRNAGLSFTLQILRSMNEHLFAAFHDHESRILSTLIRQKSGERASRIHTHVIPKTLTCQQSYTQFCKWTAAFARKSAKLSTLHIRKFSNERDLLFCQYIFLKKPHTVSSERTGYKKSPHVIYFLYAYYSSIWYNINIKRREYV